MIAERRLGHWAALELTVQIGQKAMDYQRKKQMEYDLLANGLANFGRVAQQAGQTIAAAAGIFSNVLGSTMSPPFTMGGRPSGKSIPGQNPISWIASGTTIPSAPSIVSPPPMATPPQAKKQTSLSSAYAYRVPPSAYAYKGQIIPHDPKNPQCCCAFCDMQKVINTIQTTLVCTCTGRLWDPTCPQHSVKTCICPSPTVLSKGSLFCSTCNGVIV